MNKTTLNSQKEKHSMLSLRRATGEDIDNCPKNMISIHALLAESDTFPTPFFYRRTDFYPRSPCGERRCRAQTRCEMFCISIHALLAESDRAVHSARYAAIGFLSTLSLRRATTHQQKKAVRHPISIHALLAESDNRPAILSIGSPCISIHALLAESDAGIFASLGNGFSNFYPRSPCGERPTTSTRGTDAYLFLSTLSLRRATLNRFRIVRIQTDFYPRSPCGERRWSVSPITSPPTFLSTLSLRRATFVCHIYPLILHYFYPRSPCGERPAARIPGGHLLQFLSTLSLRRATKAISDYASGTGISIHALLAESDIIAECAGLELDISIHALLAESDRMHPWFSSYFEHFYPRSPCGERPDKMPCFL